MSLSINPMTKLGEILTAYPDAEPELRRQVPALATMENAVLRQAFLNTTTLDQAAKLTGANLSEMVSRLKQAAGDVEAPSADSASASPDGAPVWWNAGKIRHTIDADAMLATGVHPMGKLAELARTLDVGGIVKLDVSFRPQPLLDAMSGVGLGVFSHLAPTGRYENYFCRVSEDPEVLERLKGATCGGGDCG